MGTEVTEGFVESARREITTSKGSVPRVAHSNSSVCLAWGGLVSLRETLELKGARKIESLAHNSCSPTGPAPRCWLKAARGCFAAIFPCTSCSPKTSLLSQSYPSYPYAAAAPGATPPPRPTCCPPFAAPLSPDSADIFRQNRLLRFSRGARRRSMTIVSSGLSRRLPMPGPGPLQLLVSRRRLTCWLTRRSTQVCQDHSLCTGKPKRLASHSRSG